MAIGARSVAFAVNAQQFRHSFGCVSAPSYGDIDAFRDMRVVQLLDGIALKVKNHRTIRRVIDDETRGRTEEIDLGRSLRKLLRLSGEGDGRLRQVEGDFQPTFGSSRHSIKRD